LADLNRTLSKSRFLAGRQCELRLWYKTNEPELGTDSGAMMESVFAIGHAVGELARKRFPGGVLVEQDYRQSRDAVANTQSLLDSHATAAIYECAVEHQGVLVRADILRRASCGAWELAEVKSTAKVKRIHDLDLAVQVWVLRGAGVAVNRASVLTLDRRYLWPGGGYDLEALFRLHDRTAAVEALLPELDSQVEQLQTMLGAKHAPSIAPGKQCTTPYRCPFLAHCTRDVSHIEWPLSCLPSLHAKRREAIEALGIDDVREIPAQVELSALQQIAREAVITGEEVVHGNLAVALATVEAPVHHLDFETLGPAIPRYANTRAYDAVPFQFSIHSEMPDGTVRHTEYLHPDGSDPREPLAQALLDALGDDGSIVVYSDFEQRTINALATGLPQLADPLRALVPRLWDLHRVVRDNYYHPQFRGSFSIKSVLPALVAELSYTDLTIADGRLAAIRYEQALDSDDPREREAIFAALREYCGRDTLALLRIREVLAQRAGA
jgi:hypothetical protein